MGFKTAGLLAGLGSGMGKVGEHLWQKQRDEAEAMKQENLLRLRQTIEDQSWEKRNTVEEQQKIAAEGRAIENAGLIETKKAEVENTTKQEWVRTGTSSDGKTETYELYTGGKPTGQIRTQSIAGDKVYSEEQANRRNAQDNATKAAGDAAKAGDSGIKSAEFNSLQANLDRNEEEVLLGIVGDNVGLLGPNPSLAQLRNAAKKVDAKAVERLKAERTAAEDNFRETGHYTRSVAGAGGRVDAGEAEAKAQALVKAKDFPPEAAPYVTGRMIANVEKHDQAKAQESLKKAMAEGPAAYKALLAMYRAYNPGVLAEPKGLL